MDPTTTRRLGGFALVYSLAYTLAFGTGLIMNLSEHHGLRKDPVELVVAVISIGFGIAVYLLCRRDILPRSISVPNLAGLFEVIASLGIMANAWGWESKTVGRVMKISTSLGIDSADYQTRFLTPLVDNGVNLLTFQGVAWVGILILIFPMLIPSSPRRTLIVSLGAFTTGPLVLFGSLAAHGVPVEIRPWLPVYMAQMLIPVMICVVISVFGSMRLYRLSQDLSRAREMGSYRLVKRIGVGGMGEVWLGEHQMLARPAAIKIIRPEMLGQVDSAEADTIIRRFEQEAQATAALDSPHTIQIYDFGRTETGTFFYVMELLEGYDLRTLITRHGPLPAIRVIALLKQVCHSLEDAHRRGLTHRDIKPANIFISRRGQDNDFVKVLDFGLVKGRRTGDIPIDTQLTTDGISKGTPAFMAPEMVADEGNVDHRADIYALGCVAFWLLVGRDVFVDRNPMNLIVQHVKTEPPSPSSCSELEISPELDRIVLDCLAKDPDIRPQSARDLALRLDLCPLAGERWGESEAEEWWRNNPGQ